jgi:hypothetical protein
MQLPINPAAPVTTVYAMTILFLVYKDIAKSLIWFKVVQKLDAIHPLPEKREYAFYLGC